MDECQWMKYRGAKSRTPLMEILLFYMEIPRNPFVLGKISYVICKSELPLVKYHITELCKKLSRTTLTFPAFYSHL